MNKAETKSTGKGILLGKTKTMGGKKGKRGGYSSTEFKEPKKRRLEKMGKTAKKRGWRESEKGKRKKKKASNCTVLKKVANKNYLSSRKRREENRGF